MLSALQGMDAGFLLMLQDARTAWLDPLAAGYTSLGNGGMIWIAVSLAMLCHRNTRPAAGEKYSTCVSRRRESSCWVRPGEEDQGCPARQMICFIPRTSFSV